MRLICLYEENDTAGYEVSYRATSCIRSPSSRRQIELCCSHPRGTISSMYIYEIGPYVKICIIDIRPRTGCPGMNSLYRRI